MNIQFYINKTHEITLSLLPSPLSQKCPGSAFRSWTPTTPQRLRARPRAGCDRVFGHVLQRWVSNCRNNLGLDSWTKSFKNWLCNHCNTWARPTSANLGFVKAVGCTSQRLRRTDDGWSEFKSEHLISRFALNQVLGYVVFARIICFSLSVGVVENSQEVAGGKQSTQEFWDLLSHSLIVSTFGFE